MIRHMLLESLLASLPDRPIPVRRLVVGLHFTAVSSLSCGLSASLSNRRPHHAHPVRDAGSLLRYSAQELARLVLSENLTEASIGLAALNSLLGPAQECGEQINAAEVLAREARDRRLAIVGHFSFIESLRPLARACWVIEQDPGPGDLPEAAAADYLPQADVIAITASAIANHSIDHLLALCPRKAEVMILGPSTPITSLLFAHGATILSGVRVMDEDAVMRSIEQGAIFPQVNGVCLITMQKPGEEKGG